MTKKLLAFFLLCFTTWSVCAQSRIITGTVTSDSLPLIGVSINVKGTRLGTSTKANGTFSIDVPVNAKTLLFSYVGYQTREIAIGSDNHIDLALTSEIKQLENVVVAFGTTRKRTLTNSVAQITAEDLDKRPITNLNSALAGAAPGVQTNAGNGQPGEGPDVRIRGFSSINNGNAPLYVLDGAPYEGVLNNINVEDIESISILKDASASALYGARAANGVVLITTKRGRINRNQINFKLSKGLTSRALPDYNKLNAFEYFPLMWETLRNSLISSTVTKEQAAVIASATIAEKLASNPFNVANGDIVRTDGTINPAAALLYPEDLSWNDALRQQGIRSDYSVSFSGGTSKNDYYASIGYLKDQGFSLNSDFERVTGRIRVNTQPKKWLKAGFNLGANYTTTDQAIEGSGINENPFYIDLIQGPIYPVYMHDSATGAYVLDANGNKRFNVDDDRPLFAGRNVVLENLYNVNQIKRNALTANVNVEILLLKGLKFTSNLASNLNNYRSIVFDNRVAGDAVGVGRTARVNTVSTYLNLNQLLNYDKTFGRHTIKVLAGHESYRYNYDYFNGARRGMIVDGTTVLDNYTTTTALGSYDREYRTEGYLSRLEYNFADKYSASASYRRDGSSKFDPGKRWGNFWSLGAAWNIDKEPFFYVDWIDQLKIRSSYGAVGNDNLSGYFLYQALYTLGYNNGPQPGMMQASLASPDLSWETSNSVDAAVEFAVLKNRITGTIELFHRQSDNLLFDLPLPLTSGIDSRNVNLGSMRNRGVEIQLAGDIIKQKKFGWNLGINWTSFNNKIMTLPSEYEGRVNGTRKYSVGQSLYEFWTRQWYGVNPETGADLYWAANTTPSATTFATKNGDTVTTSTGNARYAYSGSAIPDFYGSINSRLSYKDFSLDLLFMFQVGGKTFNNDYESLMYPGSYGRALHKDALNRWQNPGDITNTPKRQLNIVPVDSDRWMVDATYLNFRSASLTYGLPNKFATKLKVQNARIYLTGENLFITSKRKGLDPTQTYTGAPSYTYAPTRVVSLGINVTL